MKALKSSIICILLLTISLSFLLTGCNIDTQSKERRIYEESIETFFTALDGQDFSALKSLFSRAVIQSDDDLDEQIHKLMSIYPKDETKIFCDGLLGGDYKQEYGKCMSTVYTTFPIVCDGEYFWVYYELVYEDDFSEENIGISRVFFYTADEYCIAFHDDSWKLPKDMGLLVYADRKVENEIRAINKFPYEFIPIARKIDISDVEAFLKLNKNLSDFTKEFGEPNAKDSNRYYYEIESEDAVRYLVIGIMGEEVYYANLVGEFDFIKCIFRKQIKYS
ncbi:MAG: DUF5104 domain-containing protein [Clostridia bacterium]|nr:DUF5104 domain-containing protein [Clostridia bacterium]